jgi:hypothetical protein
MPHEKRLVDGDILQGFDALAFFQFQHAVHQQDGVAVGQFLENLVNVHHDFSSRLMRSRKA